jgi:diguanylate cyclase (GGDEF)-like protein/PAS domain S-box-containing protein
MADDTDFRFVAENSPDVICRFGLDRRLHYVSPSCQAIFGWTPEEIVAMPPFALVFPEDIPRLIEAIERDLLPGAVPTPITLRNRRRDGSIIWMEVFPSVVRDDVTGEAMESVIVMRDVTERKQMEERLAALAYTDGLTGLCNRRAFDEVLAREWKRTLQQGSQMSLILLDVDHFKQFNDAYGHQVGDDCLRAVANAVKNSVRPEIDTSARYGGEELAVILPSTDSVGAVTVAEAVRQAILRLEIVHSDNVEGRGTVSASFGVSTAIVRSGGTIKMPEGLLMSADHALYKAKHSGRNRIASTILIAPSERT